MTSQTAPSTSTTRLAWDDADDPVEMADQCRAAATHLRLEGHGDVYAAWARTSAKPAVTVDEATARLAAAIYGDDHYGD